MSRIKRGELNRRRLTPQEVSDLRFIRATGSARQLLAQVERIIANHVVRAVSTGAPYTTAEVERLRQDGPAPGAGPGCNEGGAT